jgi:beta-lactamase class A
MGVAIKHLETGQELAVNGDRSFPMASTVKVPILVELFNQVDSGEIRLDEMASLAPYDLHLGSGQLKEYVVPGVSLSMENLALLMMRVSDNTATDIVLKRVGIDHVNRRLSALGIGGISINRSTQDLIMGQMGFQDWNTDGMTHHGQAQRLRGRARGAGNGGGSLRPRRSGYGDARRHESLAGKDPRRAGREPGCFGENGRHHAQV